MLSFVAEKFHYNIKLDLNPYFVDALLDKVPTRTCSMKKSNYIDVKNRIDNMHFLVHKYFRGVLKYHICNGPISLASVDKPKYKSESANIARYVRQLVRRFSNIHPQIPSQVNLYDHSRFFSFVR
jgi:uncharacterized membrane protein